MLRKRKYVMADPDPDPQRSLPNVRRTHSEKTSQEARQEVGAQC